MLDTNDLLNTIKKAAVEAVEAEKPVNILFGKVTSASPLKINIEKKMILTSEQLILTNAVANIDISHLHEVSGTETFTVYNGLVVGDEVVLLRMQGGQKYIVLDRVVAHDTFNK